MPGSRLVKTAGLLVACCLLSAYGVVLLVTYANTPGELHPAPRLSETPVTWRAGRGHHALVMAIHPKCPCTRATVEELTRLLTKVDAQIDCLVLAYRPAESLNSFIETDTVSALRALPKVKVETDVQGELAEALGMKTSGSIVLYSPDGDPLFSGGITASRGHCGPSPGGDAVRQALSDPTKGCKTSRVFGCPIQAPSNCQGGCSEPPMVGGSNS